MSTEPTMQERLDRLDEEKARVSLGGGQDKIKNNMSAASSPLASVSTPWWMKIHSKRPACLPPTAPRTLEWIRPMRLLTVW